MIKYLAIYEKTSTGYSAYIPEILVERKGGVSHISQVLVGRNRNPNRIT
ncbi:MAG: hypothetical protein GY765_14135 [bacterium]|nr:hypothetical protein [bacterium]